MTSQSSSPAEGPGAASTPLAPPPAHAEADYQLGGAYTPPNGVTVVSRDRTAAAASGLYNICYVNAFQAQPGAESKWDADLLLRDDSGQIVMDKDWNEAIFDIRTPEKRQRIAATVDTWIDECAAHGYQAVEPDNYDSYTRAGKGILTADDAEALQSLLAHHAHEKGLAIAQKNTPDLAGDREKVGVDFAVAEECGQYDECDVYRRAFGDHVIVIEYTDKGMAAACAKWGSNLSIVQRDRNLVPAGQQGYVYKACGDA